MKPETLHRLLVLAAIAETGSLTSAARRLGVVKSAVSHHLSVLEREIGGKVVNRDGRGVKLTGLGEILAGHARRIVQEASLAMLTAREAENPTGRICVSVPAGLGDYLLVPMLSSFMGKFPDIALDIVATDEYLDISKGSVDVAFRIHGSLDGPFVARRLRKMTDIFVASPIYLAGLAPIAEPSDLERHQFIGFAPFGTRQQFEFKRGDCKYEIDVQCRVTTTNSVSLKHWVLAGAGIARLPLDIVDAELASGTLVRLLADYEHTVATLSVIYMPERYRPANVRRLIEFSIDYFAE